jgi:hypothetical protein
MGPDIVHPHVSLLAAGGIFVDADASSTDVGGIFVT